MSKSQATKEDWSGLIFANNWKIIQKLTIKEYKAIYEKLTGDKTKIIKNTHYLCKNLTCGIETYMERTVIQRALNSNRDCMSKCKGCNGNKEECYYGEVCRQKNLTKVPDRQKYNIAIGDIYNSWEVIGITESALSSDHQCRATCKCQNCGLVKDIRFDILYNIEAACECFKSHSVGEHLIKQTLDNNKIKYKTECTFSNLVGLGSGSLRYDFGIFNSNNQLLGLIEFDGQQHYQDAGSYYNPTGKVQIHDELKNQYAIDNNIPLLRIPYYQIKEVEKILFDFFKKL
jgi:hypothetical protein